MCGQVGPFDECLCIAAIPHFTKTVTPFRLVCAPGCSENRASQIGSSLMKKVYDTEVAYLRAVMPLTIGRLKSKPEVEFQYGGRSFSIPEVVIMQPWLEISLRNASCQIHMKLDKRLL